MLSHPKVRPILLKTFQRVSRSKRFYCVMHCAVCDQTRQNNFKKEEKLTLYNIVHRNSYMPTLITSRYHIDGKGVAKER